MKVKHVYPSCFVSGFPLVTHDGRERGRVGMADPVERKESSDRTDRDKMESPQGILLSFPLYHTQFVVRGEA